MDVVISDMRMPGMDGAELLKQVAGTYKHIRRIVLTGYASVERAIAAINDGGDNRYLTKPWQNDTLKLAIHDELLEGQKQAHKALQVNRLKTNVEVLQRKLDVSANLLAGASSILSKSQYDSLINSYITLVAFQMPEKVDLISNVQQLCSKVANVLALPAESQENLNLAALLHRFGELALPLEMTNKCFLEMEPWEWELYQHYPELTASFIDPAHDDLAKIILTHRNIYDRSLDEKYSLTAQVLLVCTEYVELLHFRGQEEEALAKIKSFIENNAGHRYSALVVQALVSVMDSSS